MRATGHFSPGIIDYDEMSSRYQSGRSLSGSAADAWTKVASAFLRDGACPRVLDLGSGTGRLSSLFARSLDATVVGVVRRGGHVLVRGTFGDHLDGFPALFQFWPTTRRICEQLPTVQETVAVFEANGFTPIEHRRVHQETAASLSEFARRTRARADSALMLIPDSDFREGQAAIEAAAGLERGPVPVVEVIELLAFQNGSTRLSG